MFTATEMNRISNNNFELDETMLDCMKEIENEILQLFADKFGLKHYWGYITTGGYLV